MNALARIIENDAAPAGAVFFSDHEIDLGADFRLESGEALDDHRLLIRLQGRAGGPVVIAAGGISATRKVADAGAERGWWRAIACPGGAIDTARWRVLGFDFLPGRERAAKTITPFDQARALCVALDQLGVESVRAFVGASYGGFVGLAFAALFPERIEKLCAISASARPDPMSTALRGIQRRIVLFAAEAGRAQEGVALARQLAMTTYRTSDEFRARFESAPLGPRPGDLYDVCKYLTARGRAYSETMPAARYLTLSDSLDRARANLAAIKADCLFVAAKSDRLVPADHTQETAEAISRSRFFTFDSLYGHDAFLCDAPRYEQELKSFLEGESQ